MILWHFQAIFYHSVHWCLWCDPHSLNFWEFRLCLVNKSTIYRQTSLTCRPGSYWFSLVQESLGARRLIEVWIDNCSSCYSAVSLRGWRQTLGDLQMSISWGFSTFCWSSSRANSSRQNSTGLSHPTFSLASLLCSSSDQFRRLYHYSMTSAVTLRFAMSTAFAASSLDVSTFQLSSPRPLLSPLFIPLSVAVLIPSTPASATSSDFGGLLPLLFSERWFPWGHLPVVFCGL